MRRLRKASRGSQLFGLMLPRCTSKLLACRGANLRGQREAGPDARRPRTAGRRDQGRPRAAVPLRDHGAALRAGGRAGAPGRRRR